jgi:hypothetical protein
MREEQRTDLERAEHGLRGWFRGEDTEEATAAGRNFAETLALFRERLLKGGI